MTDPDQPAAEPKKEEPRVDVPGGMPPIILKGEIDIFPDRRLPQYDQGPVKAYLAESRTREPAFALVCERALVPQIHASSKYYGLINPYLPRLFGAGVVDWAPIQQQRYVFVYDRKLGKPVATGVQLDGMGMKNDHVFNTVVRNVVPALKDMRDSDFVHGNIRLQNLFDGDGAGLEKVMLGECLSTPTGFLQPTVYETIERGIAAPLARGVSTYEDDMYSLGVMLAIMLRSSDPMAGFSDEEIVKEKIDQGSYAAITGKERFTGSMLECLRGLLNDDRRLRWTIDDVITWMEGRRVHPKQAVSGRLRASRPIDFGAEKILRPQLLALEMANNPKETLRIAEGPELAQWLNRSLQDKPTEDRAGEAFSAAESTGNPGFFPERLSSYLALALYPGIPLIYRNTKIMPDAVGRLMVEAVLLKKDLGVFVDIIQNQMALYWSSVQDASFPDTGDLITRFETCRAFMRQTVSGYGIERCIYYLAPEAQCLSEKFKDFFVRSPEDMLMALERLCATGNAPEQLFDRHVIAFLSVRDRQVIDPYIPDLNSEEKFRHVMACMRILAFVQKRSKMPDMPAVTNWLVVSLEILINRFHDRETRSRIKAQMQKIKDKGDIEKISGIFDNPQIFVDDFKAFRYRMRDYGSFRTEYNHLQHELENNKQFGYSTGKQAATLVSAMVSGIIIILYLTYKFSSMGGHF